eukprot:scaffold16057_cov15-Tisochrysis_lutea.AAC.1
MPSCNINIKLHDGILSNCEHPCPCYSQTSWPCMTGGWIKRTVHLLVPLFAYCLCTPRPHPKKCSTFYVTWRTQMSYIPRECRRTKSANIKCTLKPNSASISSLPVQSSSSLSFSWTAACARKCVFVYKRNQNPWESLHMQRPHVHRREGKNNWMAVSAYE